MLVVLATLVPPGVAAAASAAPDSLEPPYASAALQIGWQNVWPTTDGVIVDRAYGRRPRDFTIDALSLRFDRMAARGRREAGLVVRATLGDEAASIHAPGLELGRDVDLTQAYAVLRAPLGRGRVQLSAGKLVTLLGYELLEPDSNANVSVGNAFVFVENSTELGADAEWRPGDRWDVHVRVTQGWDVVEDDNRSKSYAAQLKATPNATWSFAALGYAGPERVADDRHWRAGGECIVTRTDTTSAALQLDWGHEAGLDASWSAASAWLTTPAFGGTALSLRADVVDDPDGARTSGVLGFPFHDGQTIWSATVTLAFRAWPGALVRPELRYDRSSLHRAFHDHPAQLGAGIGITITT